MICKQKILKIIQNRVHIADSLFAVCIQKTDKLKCKYLFEINKLIIINENEKSIIKCYEFVVKLVN